MLAAVADNRTGRYHTALKREEYLRLCCLHRACDTYLSGGQQ